MKRKLYTDYERNKMLLTVAVGTYRPGTNVCKSKWSLTASDSAHGNLQIFTHNEVKNKWLWDYPTVRAAFQPLLQSPNCMLQGHSKVVQHCSTRIAEPRRLKTAQNSQRSKATSNTTDGLEPRGNGGAEAIPWPSIMTFVDGCYNKSTIGPPPPHPLVSFILKRCVMKYYTFSL
jgi:hypothetical protein